MSAAVSEYESTRQRHVESMMGRLPAHLDRLGWSAARLRAERTTRLRELLLVARARSPWHRDRLAGVDIDRVDDGRMQALPVMTKADLLRHFDAIVTDRRVTRDLVEAHIAGLRSDAYLLDELHAVASGGSSGVRGVFVWGWDAWADCWLVGMRNAMTDALSDPGVAAPPVLMAVAAENASHFTGAMTQTFAGLAAQVHRFPVTLPLADIVAGLNQANGDVLLTYASMLLVLAAEARAGRLTITPRRIVATAEPLLPEIRAAAAQAWAAPIANQWGTSEGGIVALGCFRGEGMHLTDDLVIVEAVDERGEPLPPGVPSAKIYLTNLFNPVLPLIRYEITDQVTVLDEPCPCGSAFRRIADIQGRLDDVFTYAGGVVVHPHVFRSVLAREAAVIEYQVRQTPRGAELLVVANGPVETAPLERALVAELGRLGCREPVVTAHRLASLPRSPAGKLKRFVPIVEGEPAGAVP